MLVLLMEHDGHVDGGAGIRMALSEALPAAQGPPVPFQRRRIIAPISQSIPYFVLQVSVHFEVRVVMASMSVLEHCYRMRQNPVTASNGFSGVLLIIVRMTLFRCSSFASCSK